MPHIGYFCRESPKAQTIHPGVFFTLSHHVTRYCKQSALEFVNLAHKPTFSIDKQSISLKKWVFGEKVGFFIEKAGFSTGKDSLPFYR